MRRAHTLTELLVVLTILALFSVVAIPRFAATAMRSRLDAAVDALRANIGYTRARAVSTGLRHQMFLDAETFEITVQPFRPEQLETQGTAVQQVPEPVLRDRLPELIRVTDWSVEPLGYLNQTAAASTSDQPLTFYPEGNGDSVTIVLEDNFGERRGLRLDGYSGEIVALTPEELR